MSELINGRTPEEIKHVAEWNCYSCGGLECDDCSYLDACTVENRDRAVPDALALIERLESERDAALAKVPRWISVEERLPEDGELVLCILYGDVNGCRVYEGAYELAMHFNAFEDDGEFFEEEWDMWDRKRGEVSNIKVTHWIPLPSEPKEGE